MQLHLRVECSWDEADEAVYDEVLTTFDEQEKIGIRVGRLVRDWLRQVPVRRQGDRANIYLAASWDESTPRAPRKSKKASKGENADG